DRGPRLGIVDARAGGLGDGGADRDLGPPVRLAQPLVIDVERGAEGAAVIVDGAAEYVGGVEFVVDRDVTATGRPVDADAPGVVVAEAARDVEGAGELRIADEAQRDARQVALGALGDQVDAAADAAAARRRAVEEGAGPVDHLLRR